MTPEFMFSALSSVVIAAFTFLIKDRVDLKAELKAFTSALVEDNKKKTDLADRVPSLLAKIEDLERRVSA